MRSGDYSSNFLRNFVQKRRETKLEYALVTEFLVLGWAVKRVCVWCKRNDVRHTLANLISRVNVDMLLDPESILGTGSDV